MRSPFVKVAILLVLGLGLIAWQMAANARGGISAPAGGVALVLWPVQKGLIGLGNWISDVGQVMVRRGDIRSENERLRARLADAEGQNQRLLRYRRENEELRKLLKMPPLPGGKSLAAEIIGYDATDFTRHVTLNVGARAGVRPKDVVYTASGVVGQVIAAAPFSSQVLLLTDREAAAGAMTSRTLANGIVLGTGERICKFSYLDFGADVREGDLVVTNGLVSGKGAIFPKGLVIGRVLKVERDKTYSRLDAYIDPAVSFDRLNVVYVRVKG